MKKILYIIIIILVCFLISYCNDSKEVTPTKDINNKTTLQTNEKNNNVNSKTNSSEEDQTNTTIKDNANNTTKETKQPEIIVGNYNKETLKKWVKDFYFMMKTFRDEDLKEATFVKQGVDYLKLGNNYEELYINLEEIREYYDKNITNPPSDLPEIIYEELKGCKEYFLKAMDYRIAAVQMMLLLIDELQTLEEKQPGEFTNPNLTEYQKNTKEYDKIFTNIVVILRNSLLKLGYELEPKTGELKSIKS